MKNSILVVLFASLLMSSMAEPCSKSSPGFNGCFKDLLNGLYSTPQNKEAVKSIFTDKITIASTKDFKVDGTFKQVQFKGFEKLQISEIKSNVEVSMSIGPQNLK
jgi:hypothetical protein